MLIPGPELFASRPEFISGLYLSLLAMNVIILIFLLFATPMIVALTRINTRFIGVVILALTLVGTYTANYNITDPLMALVFGLIGFILKRHNIPIVPIVLGVVLGPIFEARLRQALGTAGGDMAIFVERPLLRRTGCHHGRDGDRHHPEQPPTPAAWENGRRARVSQPSSGHAPRCKARRRAV